jgi:hypothetical protein
VAGSPAGTPVPAATRTSATISRSTVRRAESVVVFIGWGGIPGVTVRKILGAGGEDA